MEVFLLNRAYFVAPICLAVFAICGCVKKSPEILALPTEQRPAPVIDSDTSDLVEAVLDGYVLQPSDEIDLQVFREPEFSGIFTLSAAGDIRHPLAGVIHLAGRSVNDAEKHIHEVLAADYLVSPKVIVKVTKTESSQIVVFGEVKQPGIVPVPPGEPVTLLKVIALAGGFTDLASPDRVRIVRKNPEGGTTTIRAQINKMLGGSIKHKDIPLEPGDMVVVPEVVF